MGIFIHYFNNIIYSYNLSKIKNIYWAQKLRMSDIMQILNHICTHANNLSCDSFTVIGNVPNFLLTSQMRGVEIKIQLSAVTPVELWALSAGLTAAPD